MMTLEREPPSATMKTASLSPPSPEEQDTPRPNFTIPPSKSVTSMGSDRVDSPAAVGKVPDAVDPPLLGVLGVVELELPPEGLLSVELPAEPDPPPDPRDGSLSPESDELSSSPESEEDSSPEPEDVSSSPDPEEFLSSEVESSDVFSSPSLVSFSSEVLSSLSFESSEESLESLSESEGSDSLEDPESPDLALELSTNLPAADNGNSKETVLKSAPPVGIAVGAAVKVGSDGLLLRLGKPPVGAAPPRELKPLDGEKPPD